MSLYSRYCCLLRANTFRICPNRLFFHNYILLISKGKPADTLIGFFQLFFTGNHGNTLFIIFPVKNMSALHVTMSACFSVEQSLLETTPGIIRQFTSPR